MARFKRVENGEWVQPVRRGYKLMCCDCGLTHTLNFRLRPRSGGRVIQFQAFRNERSTALSRRARGGDRVPLGKNVGKNIRELRADNRKSGKARGANGKPRPEAQIKAIALKAAGKSKGRGR